MTKLKATRKLSDISFEHEGSHVALVGDFQGGAANGFSTLITKATNDVSDEDLQTALEQDLNKSQTKEEDNNMSTMTTEQVQEMIAKALEAKEAESAEAIEKAVEAAKEEAKLQFEAQSAELQVLKALEDSRKEAKFVEVAKSHTSVLGEAVEEAELAKALKEADGVEALATLTKALDAYKNIVKNADKLVEVGKSNTVAQPTDTEAKLDAAVTKYREENGVSEAEAMKALSESQPELFSELYA